MADVKTINLPASYRPLEVVGHEDLGGGVRRTVRIPVGALSNTISASSIAVWAVNRVDLDSLLDYPARAGAYVVADADTAKRGVYIKTGASGAGGWGTKVADLLVGPSGAPAEMQIAGGYLQWRNVGGTTWTNLVPVSAITGPPGATGAKGDKGDTGATGAKGDRGDTGFTGAPGAVGAKGDTGLAGAKGDKGDTGNQGAPGADGGLYPYQRPGLGLQYFTGDTVLRDPSAYASLDPSKVVATDEGPGWALASEGYVVTKQRFPVEPDQIYGAQAVFIRLAPPSDPSGDTLRFGLLCYASSGALIAAMVLQEWASATIGERIAATGLFTRLMDRPEFVDALPAATITVRPFFQAFGGSQSTALITLEWAPHETVTATIEAAAAASRAAANDALNAAAEARNTVASGRVSKPTKALLDAVISQYPEGAVGVAEGGADAGEYVARTAIWNYTGPTTARLDHDLKGIQALIAPGVDPRWQILGTDVHGRLQSRMSADETRVTNVGLRHQPHRGAVHVLGPRGVPVSSILVGPSQGWLLGAADANHGAVTAGIRTDEIRAPKVRARNRGGVIGLYDRFGEPSVEGVIGPIGDWQFKIIDRNHGSVRYGLRNSNRVYPTVAIGGPPPDMLNRGALRQLEIARSNWDRGLAYKHGVAVIGDSQSAGGIRWIRNICRGPGSIYSRFGDGGGGWCSFVTSNVRGWSGGYQVRRASPVAGLDESDAYWLVKRRTPGANGPDISSITPLQPSTDTYGTLSLWLPSDSVPLSSVYLHYNAIGACLLRYRWNGGAWTDLALAESGGPSRIAIGNLPSAPGGRLDIRYVSGTTELHGLMLDSSNSGITLSVLGVNGSHTGHWTANDPALHAQALGLIPAKTWLISLSTNDQGAGFSAATHISQIEGIIGRIRASDATRDVGLVYVPENFGPHSQVTPVSIYEEAARAYCASDPLVSALFMQSSFGVPGGDYRGDGPFPAFDLDGIHIADPIGGALAARCLMRNVFN